MARIFDRLALLADDTRSRLLLVLERHELSVSELCAVLQLPQSTVSRHLKVLGDAGMVESRASGTSRHYRGRPDSWDSPTRRLWTLVREQLSEAPTAAQDAHRLEGVLARRRTRSEEFFSTSAGQWDRMREELFGSRAHLQALLALLDPGWTLGDLGCGTGYVAEVVAPYVGRVIGVDSSGAMLTAARKRLARLPNVELRRGELESLPVDDGELDVATLFLVLDYLPEPAAAIAEAARALGRRGRLVILDMMPHDREEYRQEMGHVWLGFSREQLGELCAGAGLEMKSYVALPADPAARGPVLFAAAAERSR